MRVLAADPGYERLGIAVLEQNDSKEDLLYSDCFQTNKDLSFEDRLLQLGKEFERLLHLYKPKAFASEALFFAKNQKTAIDVASVRGALMYTAKKRELPFFEYTPLQIKMAVTGYGKSDKQQVTEMVKKLVTIKKKIRFDDEFDAIAVGLTCLASERF